MPKLLFFSLSLLFVLIFLIYRQGVFFEFSYKSPFSPFNLAEVTKNSSSIKLSDSVCDMAIWKHVYIPARLLVIQPCVALEGVVGRIDLESDGDNHIYFKPDKDSGILNGFNNLLAGGNIIAEVVCLEHAKLDKVAEKSCQGYKNRVIVPKSKTHVKMYGSLILDKDVGWIEIHPVTAIVPE